MGHCKNLGAMINLKLFWVSLVLFYFLVFFTLIADEGSIMFQVLGFASISHAFSFQSL